MLIPIVISPEIFNFEQFKDTEEELFFFSTILHFLNSCKKKALILVDEDGVMESYIKENISRINLIKVKKRLMEFYKLLKTSGRIKQIKILGETEIINDEIYDECKKTFIIANQESMSKLIYNDNGECSDRKIPCLKCLEGTKLVESTNILGINDYSTSKLNNEMERASYTGVPNALTLDEFENIIFIPLFKYSKRIEIYDRQITGNMNEINNFKFSSSYYNNLKIWIELVKLNNPEVDLTIFSGIDVNQEINEIQILKEVQTFVNECSQNYALNIKFVILKEKNACDNLFTRSIHNRYIFTDKLNISIDRGLDLFDKNKREIRDFHVSLVEKEDMPAIRDYLKSLQVI